MKKEKIFLCLIVFVSINSFSQFTKIDTLTVEENIRKKVLDFTINSIEVCNGGKYFHLDENSAKEQMLKRYSLATLNKSCNWMNERYGKVKEIKLSQILKSNNKNLIFRYKVYRYKADVAQEVRIYFSSKDKYYGLINKIYWSDEFFKGKDTPTISINSLDIVSNERKEELEKFAFNSYNLCLREKIPIITEENTEYRSFRKDWVSLMLKECDSIKLKNGKLKSVKLDQYLSDSVYNKIYRFRVSFEKLQRPSEIRIYCNLKDKYRGIFVIDKWYSQYLPFKEAVEKSKKHLNK